MRPRSSEYNSAITLKATSQGMGHGHYDKLAMAYYDNGHEILTDYGASRFLNIEAKHGGHYTKENNTYAKQTIAHNTVVVDQNSNYGGKLKVAEQYHANIVEADFSHDGWQMVMARDTNAYPGVDMLRTIVYAKVPFLERPLICDVFRLKSDKVHDYDYPLWYNGHLVSVNYPYQRNLDQMAPLGQKAGYSIYGLRLQDRIPLHRLHALRSLRPIDSIQSIMPAALLLNLSLSPWELMTLTSTCSIARAISSARKARRTTPLRFQ